MSTSRSVGQSHTKSTRTRWGIVATLVGLISSMLMIGAVAPPRAAGNTALAAAAGHSIAPVRAAFYYPWFPETEAWATWYTPSLGKYHSSDPAILTAHVSQAKYAGLDAFLSSYWGLGTKTAQRLPLLLSAARVQAFHVAPYYEPESKVSPPTDAALRADFDALATLAVDPAWLRVAGKPVLFIYNTGKEASCAGVSRIMTAAAGRFYVNAKVFSGYRTCGTQPSSWHQYGPASAYDQQGAFSATVSPGFNKFNEAAPRLIRDMTRFRADLARQVGSGAQWQLLTSFNEWGEGTSVEPAVQWQNKSGMGDYLAAMRAAYTPPSPTATPTPTSTTPPATRVTKVLTIVVENHSSAQMQVGMPYTYALAKQYGYATSWTAIRHPSLPNYLALAGGSTAGVTDDATPATHLVTGRSVFGAALAAGKTAKAYQEGMTSNCRASASGKYAPKHNPWAYYVHERSACQLLDVPSGTTTAGALHADITAGDLPTVGQLTPDLCNDAHDCSLATADTWLKGWMTQILAGADWKSGHLAVIVTADEDDGSQGNKVLTTVIHGSQRQRVVSTPLTHYSWTKLMTDLVGAPCIQQGCTASSASDAFGLPI